MDAKRPSIEKRLEALEPAQQRAFRQRLRQARNLETAPSRLPEGPAPLSCAQQGLWFLECLAPGGSAYTIPVVLELQGPLDIAALQEALRALLERHSVLRSVFVESEGQPLQHPRGVADWSLIFENLSGLCESQRAERIKTITDRILSRGFDLETEIPFRAGVVRVGTERHIVSIAIHHIAADGWSMNILLRELAALYQARRRGLDADLKELPLQYGDFARRQLQELKGPESARLLEFWRQHLNAAPVQMELPRDRMRPVRAGQHGASLPIELDRNLTRRLRQFARQSGVTPFMVLLAAYFSLLYRYTGQTDLLVGTPSANRSHPDLEGLIGCFVNILVLRIRVSGTMDFQTLLERVKNTCVDAFTHQDLPFERLVDALSVARDGSRLPLVQTLFGLQPGFARELRIEGLRIRRIDPGTRTSKVDLSLDLADQGETVSGVLEYDRDLFDPETAERIARHYRNLLAAALCEARCKLHALPLLDGVEERRQVVEWNANPAQHSAGSAWIDGFESVAARQPLAPAVHDRGRIWTYAELNASANRLAWHLIERGIGREDIVAIGVRRGARMPLALLAVLKASAAYLPLDLSYPQQRLGFILNDSGARLLLGESKSWPLLPAFAGERLCLDANAAEIARNPHHNPGRAIHPEQLAYLIYTSGSTGQPKGVMIPERGLVNLVTEQARVLGIRENDRILQFSAFGFDAAGFEIFMALGLGASLYMAEREKLLPGEPLVRFLEEHRVTVLTVPPSALAHVPDAALPDLRVLNVAGEACSPDLPARWASQRGFFNLYGPSEATVWSSWTALSTGQPIHIGRPIAGVRLYVLDRHLNPVPVGVAGELFIGGIGVGRGYVRQAARTASVFLSDPFAGTAGLRMYRSGDRCRLRADGCIEYLGRMDQQIKLRGFRIELAEIEHTVREFPGVREAAVAVREARTGEPRLAGYVVPESPPGLDTGALRDWLKQRLPAYMCPATWTSLANFPLNAHGKLDVRALPEPGFEALRSQSREPPRNDIERALARIWEDLLGLDDPGRQDDFFVAGGHSLLAARLIGRIRRDFGVELPLGSVFETPVLSDLARAIEAALGKSGEEVPLTAVSRDAPLPLSFAQERLWFLDRLEPDSGFYNVPIVLRWIGPIRTEALCAALRALMERHEVLRARFMPLQEQARQVFCDRIDFDLPLVDLSGLDAAQKAREALRWIQTETQNPFNLHEGPVIRAGVLNLGSENGRSLHLVHCTLHHIATDARSSDVLLNDLMALYREALGDRPADLPPLAAQYADYAVWQRRVLEGPGISRQLDYWRSQLAGLPPSSCFPGDYPRPSSQSFRGSVLSLEIPVELGENLRALSREHGATLFMTLLAAFYVLLYRYSGQSDLCIGSPFANRQRPETEGLIGCFVNTLPLRCKLGGQATWIEILRRVKQLAREAQNHQDIPFESIVDALQPARSLAHSPLFQVLFGLQAEASAPPLPDGVDIESWPFAQEHSKFELSLDIVEHAAGLSTHWEYCSDLFSADSVLRMAGHYRQLLENLVTDAAARIDSLPLLSPEEWRRCVHDWNNSVAIDPPGAGLLQLFHARVERTPKAVAVEDGMDSIGYADLQRRALKVARALQNRGTGPEQIVAVLAPRTLDLVVLMLGCFHAGAAYLPLDPSHPVKRSRKMLEAGRVSLLLTVEKLSGPASSILDGRNTVERLVLEDILADDPEVSYTLPDLGGRNLAYVIFTSGSTGKPKGAMLEQRGLFNNLISKIETLQLDTGDVIAQNAGPCFDISVWQLLAPLLCGARIRMIPDEIARDPLALFQTVAGCGITILECVPSLLKAALELEWLPELPALRWLLPTGEALSPDLARRWFERYPAIPLLNAYGPAECSDDVAYHPIGAAPAWNEHYMPIGRPVRNLRLYNLDRHLNPLPIGVPGELYAGGTGVGRGYAGQAGRTAGAFLPDPFASEPGARMYRTGDRCRYREDGLIEYLGRADEQVKLRGFRIELGEVEHAARAYAGVRDAAVLLRDTRSGNPHLCAYLLLDPGISLDIGHLRDFLQQTLPSYMCPTVFSILTTWPLNANGKLDRAALPEPATDAGPPDSFDPPRGETERVLAALWEELLGVRNPGRSADFFALGGHSLLATRLIARIGRDFGVGLPLRKVFENPLLADLARSIDQAGDQAEEFDLLVPVPRDRALPLSFAQQRLWFLNQLEPDSGFYNVPMVLRLHGTIEVAALRDAFLALLKRHEILRARFVPDGDQVGQVFECVTQFDLPVLDLSELPGDERAIQAERRIEAETRKPFDLENGPPVRALLLRLGPEPDEDAHVLVCTLHHIVTDAWSCGILIREFAALYGQAALGIPADLGPLPIQYADYAGWQRRCLEGPGLDRQLDYWRSRLSGLPPLSTFPGDHPRPPRQSFRGAGFGFEIPSDLTKALNDLSRSQNTTLFTSLLAAFYALLYRHTGQTDLCLGTPVANRPRVETEDLIGFFVNTLPLRVKLGGGPKFLELLQRVKQCAMDAQSHQDIPFESIVDAVQPVRSLAHAPLFQTVFVFQNTAEETVQWPGLRVEITEISAFNAKFDLSLVVEESEAGLSAEFEYSSDLFGEHTIKSLAEQYRMVLQGIIANPVCPIGAIALVNPELEHRILEEWNATGAPPPGFECLHHPLEDAVLRYGPAPAVVHAGVRLGYSELNRRANSIAHALKPFDAGPERIVGVSLPAGIEQIAALFGVLKTGAAYLPLDPDLPPARIAAILEDVRPCALLSHPNSSPQSTRWPVLHCCEIVSGPETAAFEGRKPQPEHPAYLIYTSGSTGQPKAAVLSHRNAVHSLAARLAYYREPVRGFMLLSSFAFDSSVAGIFWTLSQGGRLVIPDHFPPDPESIAGLIEAEGISHLLCLPSLYAQLLDQAPHRFNSLKVAIIAGEPCPSGLPARHKKLLPHTALHNEYGPTEAAVWCSAACLSEQPEGSTPSIGKPVRNTRIHIVDRDLNPLPPGAAGELVIGGEGLARGYLNRPDLSAAAFIPDPFGPKVGSRLYRTGDLARHRRDGSIEYLGRLDGQIKVRGFRIEPAEIEALAGEFPGVRAAAVGVHGNDSASLRLVGYAVPELETKLDTQSLQAWLKQRLPRYMVPSEWLELAALPLNSNGKLDRKALPEPVLNKNNQEAYEEPETATERMLADIWTSLLKLERIGRRENFFDLGGHSLLAMQMIARVRHRSGIRLPLQTAFSAPSLAELALAVDRAEPDVAAEPPLLPRPPDSQLALSFAQQRLWFLDQLEPGALYNVPLLVEIRGSLREDAARRAFCLIIERHEVLRSRFPARNGTAQLVIDSHAEPDYRYADIRGMDGALDERLALDCRTPFDLARGPVLRVRLYRTGRDRHVLAFILHHIVTDGWSMGILLRDFSEAYRAEIEQGRPDWPPLSIQYADYSLWQRQHLQGPRLDRQSEYWQKQLAGAPLLSSFPGDRPRPSSESHRGAVTRFKIGRNLRRDLHERCRTQGATLFMGLLAGWFALLHRYTGQNDLCIGTPVSNRDRLETENLIGLFVNTLVLRVKFDGEPGFSKLLERVKQGTLNARSNQDLPFEAVVERVDVPRSLAHSPLFQVFFNLHNAPETAAEMNGLQLEAFEPFSDSALFDVSLDLIEEQQEIHGALEYNTDLYDPATAARWTAHYLNLLERALVEPERRIGELPLLSPDEWRRCVHDWNGCTQADAPGAGLLQFFKTQAERTPEAVAVEDATRSIGYAELRRRVLRVAQVLQDSGIGPERIVAVLAPRTVDLVVLMLGCFHAGAAYLPLDPSHPVKRSRTMLESGGTSLLITVEKLAGPAASILDGQIGVERLVLEDILADNRNLPHAVPQIGERNLAYVIFTSGSTGKPKGAMLEQRGLFNNLISKIETLKLDARDVIAQNAGPCFDVSVWQLSAGLLCGARIRIIPEDTARDPLAFFQTVADAGITILECVPSLLEAALDLECLPALPALRWLMPTGEALNPDLARRWFERYPAIPLLNAYGPAECSDDVAYYPISAAPALTERYMPIGRPIRNLRLHILDGHLNPLPVGVPGELYVGGIGVGRGYAGQAGRTASAFMPDPFAAEPGARLYRTGDRCRYRENGLIEYLERVDEQVKLRGFRIEPGEIQARLEEHPKVLRALVTTGISSEGESRLIAYVTGDLEPGGEAVLGCHLRTSLPDYMIPGGFVFLPAFPLNANGKIDRAALPNPRSREVVLDSGQSPRTPLETLLAQLWAEVLDLPRVGRDEDFFQLGGHSLLAVRLVQQIRHGVRPDCPLSAVFHAPSVARMAEWLQHGQDTPVSPLVLLNAGGNEAPLICIHPAGGHVLEYRPLADFLEGRHPVYGIQARSLGDPQESPDSIEALAEDYVEVLLKAGHDDPFHLLGWSLGGSIALAIAARLESAGREVAFLGLVDTWRQMDTDEFDDWVRHFADFLSGEDLVRLEQLDPDERKSLARCLNQPDLSPIERLEAAAHFGQSRGYWLQGIAMDLIRAQYLEDQHSTAMIRAFTPTPVKAPLSLWWAEASLDRRGRTPGNWNDVALGGCRTRVVAADHKTIVRHPQIHAEIAEALRELAATARDGKP